MKATRIYEYVFQGKRHAERKTPCQDRCGHCVTPNGWTVVMMADGVSASPLSGTGAEIAVESCREYFSEFRFSPFLDAERMRMILYDAFNYALRRVMESGRDGIPYAKYTTLHLMVCGEKIGLHWGHAGDGMITLIGADGRRTNAGKRMKHEDGGNSPVTLQDGPDFWQFGSMDWKQLDAVLMTTDGAADALEASPGETAEEMLRLLIHPPEEEPEEGGAGEYYRELFFGTEIPPDPEEAEAVRRLRAVTDDVTVVLLRDLYDGTVQVRAAGPGAGLTRKGAGTAEKQKGKAPGKQKPRGAADRILRIARRLIGYGKPGGEQHAEGINPRRTPKTFPYGKLCGSRDQRPGTES